MYLTSKSVSHTRGINFFYRIFFVYDYPRCSTYKHTVFLPKTKFPHKVNYTSRRERDHLIENSANFNELYDWQKIQNREKEFILHDGPPYANGDVHIGHAVNKILKDIAIRHKLLQGYKIHYIPGWDCHGLPIELKVLKDNDINNSKLDLSVRRKAYKFSQQTKEKQLTSFKEWGLLADWKNSYFTCHPAYITKQLRIFQDLYEKGVIYRDHKPVYWSPSNRTSLAEAELEYNTNHISPSVYVKFLVVEYPDSMKPFLCESDCNLNLLIWTTTPWTLPANQAVCYSESKTYCIVKNKSQNEYYIIAEEMKPSLTNILKTQLVTVHSFEASCLSKIKYLHPVFKSKDCSLIPANHVTMTKGTGLVHTAPNHGFDDYFVAKKHNLPIDVCLVDDNGNFTNDAGQELAGKAVLSDGSKQVIQMLQENIVCTEDYVHSYPYDWRSKTPVIIKSSHQWFIDVQKYRSQAMDCLENVNIYPDHLKKQFLNLLTTSPQWCISRQRIWGVPIPALYSSESKSPIVHRNFTEHLCKLIEKYGIHCWWELDLNELLPSNFIESCGLPNVPYKKGTDIMDIWFDSGISWKNVLPEPCMSDLCIEGVDQIRGWFYSSLMTSVAVRGKAPYKSLLFHGFTTDAEGRKMSKSEGNVVNPFTIMCGSKANKVPAYGIDVLRWWVASHACQHENIAVKIQILNECSQNINKLRNIFKFLLGSLFEFNLSEDIIAPSKMRPLDVYLLHLLKNFFEKVKDDYDNFQFKNVAKEIINFTTNDVSSFYCQLIKDRLYCDARDSLERLSCQTVLYFILNTLAESIGAICPHLAEEVLMHHPNPENAKLGLFRSSLPSIDEFLLDTPIPSCFAYANEVRQTLLKADVKTFNLDLFIIGNDAMMEALERLNMNVPDNSGCTEFFQASSVTFSTKIPSSANSAVVINGLIKFTEDNLEPFTILVKESSLMKCPRCWRHLSTSSSTPCNRCLNIVNKESKVVSKA